MIRRLVHDDKMRPSLHALRKEYLANLTGARRSRSKQPRRTRAETAHERHHASQRSVIELFHRLVYRSRLRLRNLLRKDKHPVGTHIRPRQKMTDERRLAESVAAYERDSVVWPCLPGAKPDLPTPGCAWPRSSRRRSSLSRRPTPRPRRKYHTQSTG